MSGQQIFEVQSANLVGEHARHVDQVHQQIVAQLKALIEDLEPVAREWQGGAAAAFQKLKTDYSEKHTGMDKVLNNIAVALSQNQTNYNTAESDSSQTLTTVASQTSSIQNKMNPQV